ncbi:hypothetical protein [Agrobacterium rosae]|uniref:hypothetical protein n=1 Tax=Agrobacterium rosae TaxID=1972867 RepID=UPI001296AF76|nr:hypothetical protein [Agrobacterium rosae]MCM2433652.1 hypothetical protein [Agrobacterium rosae]
MDGNAVPRAKDFEALAGIALPMHIMAACNQIPAKPLIYHARLHVADATRLPYSS